MKKSIFLKNSKYWICGLEYKMYEEFVNYINANQEKYLNYYHYFDHYDGDILFLFCRSVPKKIRGGIFGYCILDGESKENRSEGKYISVFKDNLIDRCYSKIKDIKKVNNSDQFLTLEELFVFNNLNLTHKSFSGKYIKKFLRMENIPENIGDYIIKIFDEKIKSYGNNKKIINNILDCKINKNNSISSEESEDNDSDDDKSDDSNNESENESEDNNYDDDKSDDSNSNNESENESEDNNSDDNKSDDSISDNEEIDLDNKNGLIPIMIELCKKFQFPIIKYDKKKYNTHNNPDIIEKCNYLKNHVITCEKCNIINNNKLELSYLLNESKISFREFQETDAELEEAIEKYQNCQKFDGFGYDLDKIHIKINYITDDQNIYNNCALLYTTLKAE